MSGRQDAFSDQLLAWFGRHGRKDLPWQRRRTAYRVWLSEIMLQQTQVATVIPYYERFLARFPNVQALAEAPIDEVLRLWAGLGYYARARNLHRCAQTIVSANGGQFPHEIEALESLPGIGRSTAGAILAFTHGSRHPILDGNVKRVLARYHAVKGVPNTRDVQTKLWRLADAHTPTTRVREYTQAIMDLGATVCTRTRPGCEGCPLAHDCKARRMNAVRNFPTSRRRTALPVRAAQFLIVSSDHGRALLERRPPSGIWGGLWSLPEVGIHEHAEQWCERHGFTLRQCQRWGVVRHTFTHFRLDIHPVELYVHSTASQVMDEDRWLWYKGDRTFPVGVATPVRKLLARLGDRI